METTPLHLAYFNIAFRTETPFVNWPATFAIITAYSTTGETWSPERNAAADHRLHAELLRRGRSPLRITGYDPGTGHAEPGWAAELPWAEAQELGLHFLQDALFLVEGDVLRVAHCVAGSTCVNVGAFRERITS